MRLVEVKHGRMTVEIDGNKFHIKLFLTPVGENGVIITDENGVSLDHNDMEHLWMVFANAIQNYMEGK